jgi:hypothetical protein
MQTLKTQTLIEEIGTDGHSPLKFLCEDFEIYYTKYRSGISLKGEEIDCLFYEIVCQKLLNALKIPTPDLAIIEISENSFRKEQLNKHKKFCKVGALYLGSKEIKNADLVQSVAPIQNRRVFKTLTNPYDLVKIALFDLWVNNCDRGRNNNYNLLIQHNGKDTTFYAFDHAFCFGGLEHLRIFNNQFPFNTLDKFHKSSYFKKILPFLNKQKAKNIVDNFISLQSNEINLIISEAFEDCPEKWQIPFSLKERVFKFLTEPSRLNLVKQTIWAILK